MIRNIKKGSEREERGGHFRESGLDKLNLKEIFFLAFSYLFQSPKRSRSFAASAHHHQQMSSYPNGGGTGTPSSGQYPHHQQYSQHPPQPQQTPIVRCGSCSNLSLAGGAGGQMVLYEGTPIGHELAQSQHRHSMIANVRGRNSSLPPFLWSFISDFHALLFQLAPPAAPIWYIPPSSIPPPLPPPPFAPPPPFYYTAATLPHPATPMDYKSFKQAIKVGFMKRAFIAVLPHSMDKFFIIPL
jgi:hypothetical protein